MDGTSRSRDAGRIRRLLDVDQWTDHPTGIAHREIRKGLKPGMARPSAVERGLAPWNQIFILWIHGTLTTLHDTWKDTLDMVYDKSVTGSGNGMGVSAWKITMTTPLRSSTLHGVEGTV